METESIANETELKIEAVSRLRALKVYAPVIDAFNRSGHVMCSDGPLGACYDLTEEQEQRLKDFEEQNGGLVFHVIKNRASYPIVFADENGKETDRIEVPAMSFESYLYVTKYKDDWTLDRGDIQAGQCIAFVYNLSDPELSESGAIGVSLSPAGGLVRTW